ncbi:hypothetical protein G6F37_006386 [Rhizopus arrhizus]|nr:hypothetical protein G6F38_005971 [Rhizopus arrhizus]KAG1157791.1 hypothetical protein G6F37_006386 [Rhizopus arrhizus]
MSSKVFEKLLHKSQNLIGDAEKSNDISSLKLDLGQLASESAYLHSKFTQHQTLDPAAHYFLAQGGVNVREIGDNLKKIESTVAFQPSDMVKNTDIESYLRQKHKNIAAEAVKEFKTSTIKKELEDYLMKKTPDTTWDIQESICKDTRQKIKLPETKLVSYANTIRDLNQKRLLSEPFPLIERMKQLTSLTDLTRVQENCMNDVWDLLACLTDKGANQSDVLLIQASKNWLEKRYHQNIEDTLFKYATQVKVGGLPSQTRRLLAYIRFMYKRADNTWTEPDLELQKDIPIWLYIYLLMRTGRDQLALEFVEFEKDLFVLSPNFPSYFKEYLSSSNRLLSENSRKMILTEYQQMEYGIGKYDPYKKLLYKIMGQCEMDKPITTAKTKEDHLWLQLSLIRQRSELKNLQNVLNTKKSNTDSNHDREDLNPWNQFTTLLLSLQFERAIDCLYGFETFKFEAIHFAIVLAYYGLLNPVNKSIPIVRDILHIDNNEASLDFGKMIKQYVDTFIPEDQAPAALQYFYLLTLYPTLTTLAQQLVVNYTVQTKDYRSIVGNNRVGSNGLLQPYKPLLGIQTENDYITCILCPVAKRFQMQGQFMDTVITFEIGEQYNQVLSVLNKELDHTLSNTKVDYSLIEISLAVLAHYESQAHIIRLLDRNTLTVHQILLRFAQAKASFEQEKYDQVVEFIASTFIIPMKDDFNVIQQAARQFQQYDDIIQKHISDILTITAESLYKLWLFFSDPKNNTYNTYGWSIQRIHEHIKSALAFVGLIKNKIPADIVYRLNKLEIMIST